MPVITFTTEEKISIVCEHIKSGISVSDICKNHNVKASTFYYWKNTYFPNDIDELFEVRDSINEIHARAVLRGLNKDFFLKDCKLRGWTYGKMLHNIVDLHYSIMSNRPDLQGKEMTELKKLISDKIKFK